MASVHIPVLALALPGCVVREVREIHYVQGESRATTEADVGAPGAIIAESQPPAPIVEDAGTPPEADYAWVDGYWHWDGAEWVWIDGRWVPPMVGLYFVAPSYYTSGDQCVYVPGRWQRHPDRGPRRVVRHDSGRTRYPGSWTKRHPGQRPGDDVWIGPAPRRDPAPAVAPAVREPSPRPGESTPVMDPSGPRPAVPASVGPPRASQSPWQPQPPRQPPSHLAPPPRPSAPSVSPPRASPPSHPSPPPRGSAPPSAPPRPAAPQPPATSRGRRHER